MPLVFARRLLQVLALTVLVVPIARGVTLQGRVVGVADGDTITVLDSASTQHKIRLLGIDAPERGQPFSSESKGNLSDLVFGKQVVVEYNKTDRYRRLVGKVLINGRDANLEQLKAGFAWVYRQYERELSIEDRKSYDEAETSARIGRRGLWEDPRPRPPWEFRHRDTPAGSSSTQEFANPKPGIGSIIGNKRSGIYHLSNCPDYAKIAPANREYFGTTESAERAGYRKARNCP
jgi:endonuclease YncB( thermonuclease family)